MNLVKIYTLKELGINKLEATCSVNNSASYKLLEKHGFIREGNLKQNIIINGKYVDDYIYGLYESTIITNRISVA